MQSSLLRPLSLVSKRTLATIAKPHGAATTKLYINGEFIESETDQWIPLHNPATNEIVTYVPQAQRTIGIFIFKI
ncbi:Methylmalonate-semialdehyde dehydrogenase [acylating] mitochondrial [Globomyces sp. JEL0801]|nr:Methylmalonate-semialdehyde dehydrogenase [acylating] mitochondrial [Globomyces sp. JEL0801]